MRSLAYLETLSKAVKLEHNDLLYMERAFDFNDKVAKDIMIDRTQLTVIDINKTVNDAIKLYLKTKYSRLPVVADNDKDKILGYVFNYDLIRQKQINGDVSLAKVLRHMPTTPETTPITEVLKLMISTRVPMVVVVDEYGGTRLMSMGVLAELLLTRTFMKNYLEQ